MLDISDLEREESDKIFEYNESKQGNITYVLKE